MGDMAVRKGTRARMLCRAILTFIILFHSPLMGCGRTVVVAPVGPGVVVDGGGGFAAVPGFGPHFGPHFGPRFGPRGFGPRGFGPRGFGPRGPGFGPRGPGFGPRGPGSGGPRFAGAGPRARTENIGNIGRDGASVAATTRPGAGRGAAAPTRLASAPRGGGGRRR